MRALVVVESIFGNTREVADAVARGVCPTIDTDVRDVSHAPVHLPPDVGLLIVGGPTHAFGMTRASTRSDARSGAAASNPVVNLGIREWLTGLDKPDEGTLAATFDTRISRPRLRGSAARAAHKWLRQARFELVARPASFWVEGTEGPLVAGEAERAQAWGVELARTAMARHRGGPVRA